MPTTIKRARELCLGDVIATIHGNPAQAELKNQQATAIGQTGAAAVLALEYDAENPVSTKIKVTAKAHGEPYGATGTVTLHKDEPVEIEPSRNPARPAAS